MKSTKEHAEKAGVTPRRLRELARQGRVPGAKLSGGSWVFPDKIVVLPAPRVRPGKLKMKVAKATGKP